MPPGAAEECGLGVALDDVGLCFEVEGDGVAKDGGAEG